MKLKNYEAIGEQVYTETLSNGLNIFVVPKKGFSKKYAFFATNYGGADRRFKVGDTWIDTPEGVAHFLEHKMFDTKDGNALAELSANGASPNAFTSSDITAYYFQCIDKFEENFKILLKFVSEPYFTPESVEKEQGIIGQEIGMTDDQPGYSIYYSLMKCLYSYNPLRYSVAGTVDSIAQITDKTLYDCHKVFYHPSNMALCVVGNVDPEEIIKTARDILPDTTGQYPERDYGSPEPEAAASPRFERHMDVGMPMFMIGFKHPGDVHGEELQKTIYTANLALEAVAGSSSPLYSRLYSQGLINKQFGTEFEVVTVRSHSLISGESRDPEKVMSALTEEISKVSREGIDSGLFSRLKKAYTGLVLRTFNLFDSICYNVATAYFKGYDAFRAADALDSVTKDDVEAYIRENFTADKCAMAVISPKSSQ